jgi:hypothetical protein
MTCLFIDSLRAFTSKEGTLHIVLQRFNFRTFRIPTTADTGKNSEIGGGLGDWTETTPA